MNVSRKIAIDIIDKVLIQHGYSNIVLDQELKKVKLDPKDKALVTEIVYGTIKYKYTLDKILQSYLKDGVKNLDPFILNVLRTAIYQILFLDKIPEFAAVNEAVLLAKKYRSIGASKLVNGVLRNYLRNKEKIYYNEKDLLEQCSFQYSFEPWMVHLFMQQYGEISAKYIMKGLNSIPSMTIRINNLKTTYEEAYEKLTSFGYTIEEGSICPEALKIIKGKSIESNPLFSQGWITVQDESAMLVAPLLEPQEGMKVLDLCSAPGGKTTHISELMNNTGEVFAFDVHKNKLSLIEENAKRLGIQNITCSVMDATILEEKYIDFADRVLLDVPCSGLGIIRKKPEIKWTKTKKQLKSLLEIQRKILINGSRYLKKGGVLIFSTCTLNIEENEKNVDWFLHTHPNFSIEPINLGRLENLLYNKNGSVTVLPNESMDGFFIAKIKRVW